MIKFVKNIISKWILSIREFIFLTRYSIQYGNDFARNHGRVPNEREIQEALTLAEHAWSKHISEKTK